VRERETYAAIDLGTNNCRLLVARPSADGFRVVDAFSRIVRLGEGVCATGALCEAAQVRAIEALRICAAKLRRNRVARCRAVATEACRRAVNGAAFVRRVRAETGIDLEIISHDEEACLALYGCAPLLDRDIEHALVFDIGGGSTEIGWMRVTAPELRPDREGGCICGWHSIPIGVVTLAEHHGGREISAAVYRAMVGEVLAALAPFEATHGLNRLVADGQLQMLGTSGTVTTLAGVHQRLRRYNRARIDGCYLDFETVRRVSREIAGMSYESRVAAPCIGRDRADLVVAGCAILEAVCTTWPVGRLRVADRGLREGILYTLMDEAAATCAPEAPGRAPGLPPRPLSDSSPS